MSEPAGSDRQPAARPRDQSAPAARPAGPDAVAGLAHRLSRWRKTWPAGSLAAVLIVAAAVTLPLVLAGPSTAVPAAVYHAPGQSTPPPIAFQVAGPPLTVVGGIPADRRWCRPRQVTGRAMLRPAADGVLGVVKLSSPGACNLLIKQTTPTLLGGDGQALAIPAKPNPDSNNPATNNDWAIEPAAALGFHWTGSWCGAPPRAVRVALQQGSVVAPLSGAPPACRPNASGALITGVTGLPGQPTQAALPGWRLLSARLHVSSVTGKPSLHGMWVDFSNTSQQPVTLIPARYCIGVADTYGDGTGCQSLRLLTPGDATVPANGSLRIHLPDQSLAWTYRDLRGPRFTVTFAMAGVPSATAIATKPR